MDDVRMTYPDYYAIANAALIGLLGELKNADWFAKIEPCFDREIIPPTESPRFVKQWKRFNAAGLFKQDVWT
jgi:hypothetical protein